MEDKIKEEVAIYIKLHPLCTYEQLQKHFNMSVKLARKYTKALEVEGRVERSYSGKAVKDKMRFNYVSNDVRFLDAIPPKRLTLEEVVADIKLSGLE